MTFEQLPKAEQTIINSFELMEIIFPESELLEVLDCLDKDLRDIEEQQSKPQEIINYMKNWSKLKREVINGMA